MEINEELTRQGGEGADAIDQMGINIRKGYGIKPKQ